MRDKKQINEGRGTRDKWMRDEGIRDEEQGMRDKFSKTSRKALRNSDWSVIPY